MKNPEGRVVSGGQRFELGEGARWHGTTLYVVDLLQGRLLRVADDGVDELLSLPSGMPLGAVAPIADHDDLYVAACGTGIALLSPRRQPVWLCQAERSSAALVRMNDAACDPAGRFWAGSMAWDERPGHGSLFCTTPAGVTDRVLSGLGIVNGPVFTVDGSRMYIADSSVGEILVLSLSPGGHIGVPRVFVRLEPGDGAPDGMVLDDEDHLWAAIWGKGEVRRFDPAGREVERLCVGTPQPTSLAFGGPARNQLFVTTASYGLGSTADELAGAVFAFDVGVTGPAAAPASAAFAELDVASEES